MLKLSTLFFLRIFSVETAESAVQQYLDPEWRNDLWEKGEATLIYV